MMVGLCFIALHGLNKDEALVTIQAEMSELVPASFVNKGKKPNL